MRGARCRRGGREHLSRKRDADHPGRHHALAGLKVERGTPRGWPRPVGSYLLPYTFSTSTACCMNQYIYCLLHSSVQLLLGASIRDICCVVHSSVHLLLTAFFLYIYCMLQSRVHGTPCGGSENSRKFKTSSVGSGLASEKLPWITNPLQA